MSTLTCLINKLSLRQSIKDWYVVHQRQLPWRATDSTKANPYHVLLSEFMLQQTQVQSVIPYFERFVHRFPSVDVLAQATNDEVNVFWQGLGYYSRAKNLLACAKEIVKRKEILGQNYFPSTVDDLQSLSGVGPYTSAAVAAIAFDRPVVPVDGNVMRVISRVFALDEPKGPALQSRVTAEVEGLSGLADNDKIAQGLMELGALICRPKGAKCDICPLHKVCKAFELSQVEKFPVRGKKMQRDFKEGQAHLIQNQKGEILFLRRGSKGLFTHLHVLPMTWLEQEINFDDLEILYEYPETIKHVFTHFDLLLTVVKSKLPQNYQLPKNALWLNPSSMAEVAMPKLIHKVFNIVKI